MCDATEEQIEQFLWEEDIMDSIEIEEHAMDSLYADAFMCELSGQSLFLMEWSSVGNFQAASLLFSFFLYAIGLLGMLFNYKNFLVTMMSVELMYLGAITSFVLQGAFTNEAKGSVYGLLFLVLAACESAVGLGIIIVLYRFGRSIDFASYQELGG